MQPTKRFSRKREAILNSLRSTKSHPSAEWLYQTLKPEYPDLSMGTVYRNLSVFKDEGLVITVGVVAGQERYDADVTPHTHFVCKKCTAVIDLENLNLDEHIDEVVSRQGYRVDSHELIFHGICPNCLSQIKKTN
jgi:Fur family peroxide stress response transcriptional regulator